MGGAGGGVGVGFNVLFLLGPLFCFLGLIRVCGGKWVWLFALLICRGRRFAVWLVYGFVGSLLRYLRIMRPSSTSEFFVIENCDLSIWRLRCGFKLDMCFILVVVWSLATYAHGSVTYVIMNSEGDGVFLRCWF